MSERRFPAGDAPVLRIVNGGGDMTVTVWDADEILVECDSDALDPYREGDTLTITGCPGDLEICAPARTALAVSQLAGDLRVEGLRKVSAEQVRGDVELDDLGEGADLGQVSGDLRVERAPRVVGRGPIHGDADLAAVASAEIAHLDGDLTVERSQTIVVGSVGGDLRAEDLAERLQAGSVGGDLRVEPQGEVEIVVNSVGGDLQVEGRMRSLRCSSVGGDVEVEGALDSATLGSVAGDLQIDQARELRAGSVGGDVRAQGVERAELGSVGGDCKLSGLSGSVELGNVGGDLSLQGSFVAGSGSRINVGGDASLQLPSEPNLALTATVGGEVRGVSLSASGGHKRVNLRYGAGEAELSLHVGGDLRISGAGAPESSSTNVGADGFRFDFDMDGFGREMSELGRELGRMGRELAGEISAAFAEAGAARGSAWAEQAARTVEEKARRFQEQAEEKARRAEEKARTVEEKTRLRVRINEREWQLDPERLERIKEQARRAAADGLSGAIEAVERALGRINVPPAAPRPAAPATGATIRINIDEEEPAPAADPDQERETILRMIAEGRISPEEGDLLLEALGG